MVIFYSGIINVLTISPAVVIFFVQFSNIVKTIKDLYCKISETEAHIVRSRLFYVRQLCPFLGPSMCHMWLCTFKSCNRYVFCAQFSTQSDSMWHTSTGKYAIYISFECFHTQTKLMATQMKRNVYIDTVAYSLAIEMSELEYINIKLIYYFVILCTLNVE